MPGWPNLERSCQVGPDLHSFVSDKHRRRHKIVQPMLEPVRIVNAPFLGATDHRALSDRIERMREEERTRIARELHDELGQLLTGIKLDFTALLRRLHDLKAPGDMVDRLQSVVGQVDIGIAMVRRIASDLRPAPLDHQDLGGAIEYEARKIGAQSGIPITVSNRVSEAIDPDRATAAFRIFQEAVTNAVRHAQATAITASVELRDRDSLMLTVSDNGIGMAAEPRQFESALGLLGMRERARRRRPHHHPAGPGHHRGHDAAGSPGSARHPPDDMIGQAPTLRILLVDDHPIVRRGLRDILVDTFSGSMIHEVGSGRDALTFARSHTWDVMILDLSLPDGSGLDVLKRARQVQPRLPVLILSMHAADQFARRAVAAGASGYLTKDTANAELVNAVSRLARGGKWFAPDVLEGMALGRPPDRDGQPHERLSDREYEVLRMIGSGQTVSEIAAVLTLSVKTVSTYRARVLEKMGMRTNAELTYYAVRHGLAE